MTCSRWRYPRRPKLEVRVFDGAGKDRAKGLALRVRADGSRTWAFYYRFGGKQRRLTIGGASDDPTGWTLAKARSQGARTSSCPRHWQDPAADGSEREAEEAQKDSSVSAVVEDYLEARQEDMKPRSHVESTRRLRQHWKPLARAHDRCRKPPGHCGAPATIAKDSGPVSAKRARGALSAMLAWAIGEGLCNLDRLSAPTSSRRKAARARA